MKIAVGIPKLVLADVTANTENIKNLIVSAENQNADVLLLPELSLTGATCGDLFFNNLLISASKNALEELKEFTKGKSLTVVVGLPLCIGEKLYNCAAILKNGEIIKVVSKTDISSQDNRYFSNCNNFDNKPFTFNDVSVSVVIGDAILNPDYTPEKADIILNLASINQIAGRTNECKSAIINLTNTFGCTYALASSGLGESTMDTVYAGLSFIAQSGKIIKNNKPFCEESLIFADVDICNNKVTDIVSDCSTEPEKTIERNPFLPMSVNKNEYLEEILNIQSHALARRLKHTYSKKAVIGISGGLDSTLALLVCARAMKILNRPATDILSITMPCFGTTSRTRNNSEILCNELGVEFKEINIKKAVLQHFEDIGQSDKTFDVTYENSQARERTQVLMDIANKENGMVIGTGDLSELALGWATYNGDHMSMYGVNAGIPKTLIRHIVAYEAENSATALKNVLLDILDTPVSPELLPADSKGEIAQKTEDLVGPYELHDFFIYHMVGLHETPKEIFETALAVFPEYPREIVKKWLLTFTRRFFIQQFKRSCLPDGPCVFDISFSPRSAFKMPTDASFNLWLSEIEKL